MGQASSIQRADLQHHNAQDTSPRVHPPLEQSDGDQGLVRPNTSPSRPLLGPDNVEQDSTYHRITSQRSSPPHMDHSSGARPSEVTETPRGQEDLINMEELRLQNTTTAQTTATSPASRQSAMSRLGSRILPNYVVRGLLNSGEETPAEGRAHRTGLLSRTLPRSDSPHIAQRLASFHTLGSRGITRRRSIRGPYPLPRSDTSLLPDSPPNPTYLESASTDRRSDSGRNSWRNRARLSHVRHSIAAPISQIFGQPPPPPEMHQSAVPPLRRPSRSGFTEDADHLLPPIGNMDARMDFSEPHELDSVEPAMRTPRPNSPPSPSRAAQTPSGSRRLTSTIRGRSPRLLRRDEQTPLSRVLQLAAAAIAAQLSGNTGPALPNVQSIGADGVDGSLETFIQSLQHATSVQTQAAGMDSNNGNTRREGGLPNVNFLRVFRFANPDAASDVANPAHSAAGSEGQENTADRMDVDDPDRGAQDRRLVTLVVVGVRSVPATEGSNNDNGNNARANLESLLGLPLMPPNDMIPNERGSGSLLRRADGRSRFSSHRHSMGGSTFPANYDSQRHQRSQGSSRSQSDLPASNDLQSPLPTVLSESPPGPIPPPSTPAEPGLSGVSSGANTPSRRPSSASAMLPQLNEDLPRRQAPEPTEENFLFNNPRRRRRSDSETARHRGLGSGAARRNGVVEPDNAPPSVGRSWLIYVVGTNLSENHPAFATPSLFTDNPTYEDMILLSSLLGPAKPPVASQEDVASAGGLYRLVEYDGSLVAEAVGDAESIYIADNDRCLICLCDYEAAEEVRQLSKCKHLYHRECIDEWLTTGRNSCPLCRGQGVSNSGSGEQHASSS